MVQHPEILIFCGCNRFFFKFGGGRFEKIGEVSVGVKLANKERLVKNPAPVKETKMMEKLPHLFLGGRA